MLMVYRTIELEETLKDNLVQLPYNEQGHPTATSSCSELPSAWSEFHQGQDIHHSSGQPVPMHQHSDCKNK